MRSILQIITAVIAAACFPVCAGAQVKTDGKSSEIDGIVRFDKTVNDFGDVTADQGPLTCTFRATNISGKPLVIYNVVSSCGCTGVKWTREPVQAGKAGLITATYSNDEGPYPFDKTLTVYLSGVKKPVILRLRGIVHSKKLSLEERFPIKTAGLGFKKTDIKLGNLSQGSQRSDAVDIANLGGSPVEVRFSDISDGLSISVSPNPIPAGQTARMTYIVTADRSRWGKNYYYATPVANGKKGTRIGIWAFTKEDFSDWTSEQTDNGANPMLDFSTYTFEKCRKGTVIRAKFTVKNLGGSTLHIYKADPESAAVGVPEHFPEVGAGDKATFEITLDTSELPAGNVSLAVVLTTNSPLRPVMNLYIAGTII